MREQDSVAWAAGLFEGEGCITVTRKRCLCLQLGMKDRDIVERFAAAVGVGSLSRNRRPTGDVWRWAVYRLDDVDRVMNLLLPWLGERRTERWRELRKDAHEARAYRRRIVSV